MISRITGFLSLVTLFVFVTNSLGQLMPHPDGQVSQLPSGEAAFSNDRIMARFFSDNQNLMLKSGTKGLVIYDLEKNEIVYEVFKDLSVKAMAVFPDNRNQALLATSDGKLSLLESSGKAYQQIPISTLDNSKLGLVTGIVINTNKPDNIAITDSKVILLSKDRGKTWNTQTPIKIENEPHKIIRLLIQDPYFKSSFLVVTLNEGRYQGSWETGELKEFPEKAIPHGYVVGKNSISFIPIGDNSQIFGVEHYKLEIEDLVMEPGNKKVIYMAGLGKSPVKLELQDNRVTVNYINPRMELTYTIDVNPKNLSQIITASPQGVNVSNDGGATWSLIP